MKKLALLITAVLVALPACTAVSLGSDRVQEHARQSYPAAAITSVRVDNISGLVEIVAANGANVVVDSTKHGGSQDALAHTHIDIQQNGGELRIQTKYDHSGGWFGANNGASVSYVIHVPARMSVDIHNVSGPIAVTGVAGDVTASEVSGTVKASLGRVAASRKIAMSTVSGSITVQIAKNSDAHVQAKTVSGGIHAFFPADFHKGYVGESLSGTIGAGSGSMKFSTVSGGIDITPQ